MKPSVTELYYEVKNIHERVYADRLGGSPLDKCFLMSYLFSELELKNYVEIGVYRGKSLFTVATAVKHNGGYAIGIDPYLNSSILEDDASDEIKKLVQDAAESIDFGQLYKLVESLRIEFELDDTVSLIRKASDDAIVDLRNDNISIDMLHIDGNHDTKFVKSDAENYIPLVADGGIIVFDDIDWESVNKIYSEVKTNYVTLYEASNYGVLLKLKNENNNIEYVSRIKENIVCGLKAFEDLSSILNPLDLVIYDDMVLGNADFNRLGKFRSYLDAFLNIRIYLNAGDVHINNCLQNINSIQTYKKNNPQDAEKMVLWHNDLFPDTLQAKVAYFFSARKAYGVLQSVEGNGIPFIFEFLAEEYVDLKSMEFSNSLYTLMNSRSFIKVIVTQQTMYDYLIDKHYCSESKIIFLHENAKDVYEGLKVRLDLLKNEISAYSQNLYNIIRCFDKTNNKLYSQIVKDYNDLQQAYADMESGYQELKMGFEDLNFDYKRLQERSQNLELGYKLLQGQYSELDHYAKDLQTGYQNLETAYETLKEQNNRKLTEKIKNKFKKINL